MRLGLPGQTELLRFRRDRKVAILRDADVNYVWVAANWTIFHAFLIASCRWIDGDYDFLPTSIAGIARFLVH